MPPLDQLLGPLGVAIGAVALVGVLGKLHLDADKRDRDEAAEWKAIATSSSRNLGELVPSVAKLSTAVEAEHRVATESREEDRAFRAEWRSLATEIRDNVRSVVPPRRPRSRS